MPAVEAVVAAVPMCLTFLDRVVGLEICTLDLLSNFAPYACFKLHKCNKQNNDSYNSCCGSYQVFNNIFT